MSFLLSPTKTDRLQAYWFSIRFCWLFRSNHSNNQEGTGLVIKSHVPVCGQHVRSEGRVAGNFRAAPCAAPGTHNVADACSFVHFNLSLGFVLLSLQILCWFFWLSGWIPFCFSSLFGSPVARSSACSASEKSCWEEQEPCAASAELSSSSAAPFPLTRLPLNSRSSFTR